MSVAIRCCMQVEMSDSPDVPAAMRTLIGIIGALSGFVFDIDTLGRIAHSVLFDFCDVFAWAVAAAFTVMALAIAAVEAAMPLDRADFGLRIGLVLLSCVITSALNSKRSSNFQIFCRQLDGRSITLDVCQRDTIWDVKTKIERKIGVPIAYQRVIFSGKLLDDAASLLDYKISKNATLLLSSGLRGAGPQQQGQSTSAADPLMEQRAELEARGLSVHYIRNELPKEVCIHYLSMPAHAHTRAHWHKHEHTSTG